MIKPTILLTKMGAVSYSKKYSLEHRNIQRTAAGEQGTTEAVLEHLSNIPDFNTVYFGQWRGDISNNAKYIEADVKGLNDLSLAREQEAKWNNDLSKLMSLEPKLFITIAGYASQNSWIANPDFLTCQACGIRYTGPILNAIQQLKIPRILIVNDIRNYPKEYEMTRGWNWLIPRACLSQRERNWQRIISGTRWQIREVYSAAEHWRNFTEFNRSEKSQACTIIGHAHIGDGKRLKTHDAAWRNILSSSEDVQKLKRMGMRIYGTGWEYFSKYDPELMPGLIGSKQVEQEFAKAKTTIVTITGGELYTNKARFALSQDCLPLFYGRGEPHTMDPLGKYITLDDSRRVVMSSDLLRLVKYYNTHEDERRALVDELWQKTETNWSLLDNCINEILNNADYTTEEWWQKYGGYRPL